MPEPMFTPTRSLSRLSNASKPASSNGLQRGGDAVVDEHVHAAGFFRADVLADVEIAHFAGDLAVDVGCVKAGNPSDAAFACEQMLHAVATSLPTGDTWPRPVMTTLL